MSSSRSSRRAAKTASSSARYRGLALIHSVSKCSVRNVGRMPIMMISEPISLALDSAWSSESRSVFSSSVNESCASGRGLTLNSML